MNAPATTSPASARRCFCGRFSIDSALLASGSSTGCALPVAPKSRFAQGHDAKLKSLAIRAHQLGANLVYYAPDGDVTVGEPVEMIARYVSGALAAKISLQTVKAKAAKTKASTLVGRPVAIKVGRWDYVGRVVDVNGPDDVIVEIAEKSGKTRRVTKSARGLGLLVPAGGER